MPKYIDFDALGVQSCNPDVFVNKGYAEGWNSLMRILYDAPAADVEPVRKWIPVTERLPEEPGEYIVAYHPCHWDIVGPSVKVGIDTFRGKTTWAKNKYQRVIAWQDKPEPPKEGEYAERH